MTELKLHPILQIHLYCNLLLCSIFCLLIKSYKSLITHTHKYMPHPTHILAPPCTHTCPTPHTYMPHPSCIHAPPHTHTCPTHSPPRTHTCVPCPTKTLHTHYSIQDPRLAAMLSVLLICFTGITAQGISLCISMD